MKLFFGSGKNEGYKLTTNSLFNALDITIREGKRLRNIWELTLVRGWRLPHKGEQSLTYQESITEIFYDKNVKVYYWNEWLALERDRKLKLILDEL